MKCKDMPKEPRYFQRIACAVCHNSDGTMVNKDGQYMHPNCNRPINPAYQRRMMMEEAQRAFKAGETKCQLCDKNPATGILRNVRNGNVLLACDSCITWVTEQANSPRERPPIADQSAIIKAKDVKEGPPVIVGGP
jgi:hypothetical protein